MADEQKQSKVDAYQEQFTQKLVKAIEDGTAPWQKPWKPGEQISPKNLTTDRDYRGGNASYLAVAAVEKGYSDPRWAGYRQIADAGGHVRKGEKGTPIMYVEYKSREVEKDGKGNPVLKDGHKQYTVTQRDRPMVRIHTVFNVEQTERLKLPPVGNRETPTWEANKRVEGLIHHGEVRVDHVQGDRAYYNKAQDRVVLPDPSQFPTATGYSHTALHEIGHATGHESGLNRPTMMKHEGFESQSYAREELRAEMAAMMAGEQLKASGTSPGTGSPTWPRGSRRSKTIRKKFGWRPSMLRKRPIGWSSGRGRLRSTRRVRSSGNRCG